MFPDRYHFVLLSNSCGQLIILREIKKQNFVIQTVWLKIQGLFDKKLTKIVSYKTNIFPLNNSCGEIVIISQTK